MSIRRLPLVALALVALLGAALPSSAAAVTRVNVPTVAAKQIQRIAARSALPIYLPTSFRINGNNVRAFPSQASDATSWSLSFAYVRNCGGAGACSMAAFYAVKRKKLWEPANVTLAKGVRGRYNPISCGASCGPASISFVRDGVLYEFNVEDPAPKIKQTMIGMANQAINYGPR
jgi:hypothetical protein